MNSTFAKGLLLCIFLNTPILFAQTAPEGIWQGYDGEWKHVSQQLVGTRRSHPCRQVCLASRSRSALDE